MCGRTSKCSEQKEDSPIGDRAQIKINSFYEDSTAAPVYLYTHGGASCLEATLVEALKRKERWEDASYLARIIFETMIEGAYSKELGYGIDTIQHSDIWKLIELSANEKISIFICRGTNADDYTEVWTGTFEEFLNYFYGCGELYWEDVSEEED